ncbi:acyl-ACP--UDP-N- acetylglucosamine O-acyltransferase [Plantibacter sp. YIM 135249]|uniref:acyl-ACP--UDP-N- acetylglucosamine O-acyltransferase n=1 Tax=Plantibacter sp. YIM 135249 TaxID=3423918 RepID=UPI003D347BFA
MNAIHATAIISGEVSLGRDNVIGPFVVITGPVVIGDGNWIGSGAVIGAPPEVRTFKHPTMDDGSVGAGVEIGDRNVIREAAQIHQGWKEPTTIGSDTFIMNQAYVAHDSSVEDGATLSSSVLLAGHVRVGIGATLGLGAVVHQRRSIGQGAMVGMSAVVTHDIPAFAKAYGSPARVHGANALGAERAGLSAEDIRNLSKTFEAIED